MMLAARNLLEAAEAVVDVLWRVSVVGDSVAGLDESGSRNALGCEKGTGVDTLGPGLSFEDVMTVGRRNGDRDRSEWILPAFSVCAAQMA